MEAVSPGVGNHSRRESTWNIPNTEIKKNKRKFNKAMKVGNSIKKDNKGMYALDVIELTYVEVVQLQCVKEPQGKTSSMQMTQMTGEMQGIGEMTSGMQITNKPRLATNKSINIPRLTTNKPIAIPRLTTNKSKAKEITIPRLTTNKPVAHTGLSNK